MNKKNSYTFTVSDLDTPARLDKWLSIFTSDDFPGMTRSQIQDLIDKQKITVNGKLVKCSHQIKNDDVIHLEIPLTEKTELLAANIKLDILFEDDDVIVVNKPAGLVVHPGVGHESDTLVNALLFHSKNLSMKNEERPGIVHRIDKETSGLLVVAKNDFAHDHLTQQFKNKSTHRVYYAVAASKKGIPRKNRIESILARHPTDRKKYASLKNENSAAGKLAITHYQLLEESKNMSLFKLQLETGRTHQIRVHLKELGCVIVGDLLYGYSKLKFEQEKLNRFYLHAAELGFVHPKSGDTLKFKINWPTEDLAKIKSWGFEYEGI